MLAERLRSERRVASKLDAILPLCFGRSILDVGCAGQARPKESEKWLHGRLRGVGSRVVGVDIVESKVLGLQAEGFDVRLPADLGDDTFERVVMGDVIEHVDDPAAFLAFYAERLTPGGSLIVTTPNAFSVTHWLSAMLVGTAPVNPEHTMWLDPLTLSEVADRAGLAIDDLFWVREEREPVSLKEKALVFVASLVAKARPSVSDCFLAVLKPAR